MTMTRSERLQEPRGLSREERGEIVRETRKRIRTFTRPQLEDCRDSLRAEKRALGSEFDDGEEERRARHRINAKLVALEARLDPDPNVTWQVVEVRNHPIPGDGDGA